MQKSTFLKVMGIIMIVIASLSILANVFSGLCGGILYAANAADPNIMNEIKDMDEISSILAANPTIDSLFSKLDLGEIASLLLYSSIAGLAAAILGLIAGILGLKNCTHPDKVTGCIVLCAIAIVITIASIVIWGLTSGIVSGIAVPLLTLIAAACFASSAKKASAQ